MHQADLTVDLGRNSIEYHNSTAEPWQVTLVDTGLTTMTGGRIKRIQRYTEDSPFMLTYGDGVSNIDIRKLIDFHEKSGKLATLTAVHPSGKFGALSLEEDSIA